MLPPLDLSSPPPPPGISDKSGLFDLELKRVDNITDAALRVFRNRYDDGDITKDAIFDYVYGVLHAPIYRERFANDLTKALPRIPMAPDFRAFATAGNELADLHLNYETCTEYNLRIVTSRSGDLQSDDYRVGQRGMRFAGRDRTKLVVNDHIRIEGIPQDAHKYVVNGRTPLEWFIDRYRVKQDRHSGIVNDPNCWFTKPEELVALICRIVHVSVETVRIVDALPSPFPEE